MGNEMEFFQISLGELLKLIRTYLPEILRGFEYESIGKSHGNTKCVCNSVRYMGRQFNAMEKYQVSNTAYSYKKFSSIILYFLNSFSSCNGISVVNRGKRNANLKYNIKFRC